MWSDAEPYKVHILYYIYFLNGITGIFCIATDKDLPTSDIIADLHASAG